MESVSNKPVILYAEDDQDDFEVLKDALMQQTDRFELVQAYNGTEVISFLDQHPSELPCLIVLDLNMPIMDGKQTLRWLKEKKRTQAYSHHGLYYLLPRRRPETLQKS